jgi:hypothetical protein
MKFVLAVLALTLASLFTVAEPPVKHNTLPPVHLAMGVGLGQAGSSSCTSACTGIAVTWSAYTPTIPTCSSTVTANCFVGFQLTLTPPTGSGGAAAVVGPATLTPTLTTYTWRPGGALFYGTWGLSIVAVEQGSSATDLSYSPTPDTFQLAYPLPSLAAPTGLSGSIVQ